MSYNTALFLCVFVGILTAFAVLGILTVAALRFAQRRPGETGPSPRSIVAFVMALSGSFMGPLIVPLGAASIALSAIELRRVRLGRSPAASRLLAWTAIGLCLCMFAAAGVMGGLLALGGVIR